ncbi:right-handed parallel beta-helix repeat-containing protein [Actinopolyspora mortivallis]|uniref:right-handed parallel beta-helix repeat-containing protein n=1 Tax=Actinopolyspora mortivallis TaxID=33906 RepID=UPI002158C3F6|nr:right-handed parallel beta-helix repeat-containing protein [Actinopolyspora mortivallis]
MGPGRRRVWRRVPAVLATAVLCVFLLFSAAPPRPGSSDPGGVPPFENSLPRVPGTDTPVPSTALFVSPHGADHATGGRTDPLRTLNEAVRRAESGTTVVLREGTYRQSVGIVRKRLHIRSFPGERVWFKGSRIVTDWTRTSGGWAHTGWNPDFCRDCFLPAIIDPAHPHAGLPEMVFRDGTPLRQVGTRRELEPGTFLSDPSAGVLLLGSDPNGATVEVSTRPWLLQFDGPAAAGSSLRGIGVAHYASRQEYGRRGAMVVVNSPGVTLEGNAFVWSASSGTAVFAPEAKVVDNVFSDNGLVGLMANKAHRIRLSGNLAARNNRERFALSGPAIGAAGMKITRTDHPVVRRNSFLDNLGTGWWCDLGCTNALVLGNVTRGNLKHGLFYEVSSAALLASNLIADNDGFGVKLSSSDRVRLVHNTFTGNHGSLGLYNDPRPPESDRYSAARGLSWITGETRLVNNYFAGTAGRHPFFSAADHKPKSVPTPEFVSHSDGNVYLRGEEEHLGDWYLGSGVTERIEDLSELTERTGHGEHSVHTRFPGTPFRAPERGNHLLRDGVPGKGAGRPTPPETAERLGVPPRRHPDVGLLVPPGRA